MCLSRFVRVGVVGEEGLGELKSSSRLVRACVRSLVVRRGDGWKAGGIGEGRRGVYGRDGGRVCWCGEGFGGGTGM